MLHNFYMGFDIQYHVHFQHQRLHGFSDLRLSLKNYTKMTKQGTKKAMKNNNRLKFSFFSMEADVMRINLIVLLSPCSPSLKLHNTHLVFFLQSRSVKHLHHLL